MRLLDEHNEIVKVFRLARDRCREYDCVSIKICFVTRRDISRNYSVPSASEIAGLIVGDFGHGSGEREIIVEHRGEGLKCISYLHPLYMAM